MTGGKSTRIVRKKPLISDDTLNIPDLPPIKKSLGEEFETSIKSFPDVLNTFSDYKPTVRSLQEYKTSKEVLRDEWKAQRKEDKNLRRLFVVVFLGVFIWQLYTMHDVLYLVGDGLFMFTDTQFTAFFVSVFGEITILMSIMIKYTFSEKQHIDEKGFLEDKK